MHDRCLELVVFVVVVGMVLLILSRRTDEDLGGLKGIFVCVCVCVSMRRVLVIDSKAKGV